MSHLTAGGNGHDESIDLPVELPVIPYPQVVSVPPGHVALVVPVDGLQDFVQALSREWLGPKNTDFFNCLVRIAESTKP